MRLAVCKTKNLNQKMTSVPPETRKLLDVAVAAVEPLIREAASKGVEMKILISIPGVEPRVDLLITERKEVPDASR